MGEFNVYADLGASLEFEKKHRKKLETEKNVALGVDFAATLASMLARSRGARYSLNTNNAAAVNRKIAEQEQRVLSAMRDYNGRRAALAFRSLLSDGGDVAPSEKQPQKRETGQRRALFPTPISLMEGKVSPRRPQLIEIKPFKQVKPLIGKNYYGKQKQTTN